jgi:curved DNA-binding protein CbpA
MPLIPDGLKSDNLYALLGLSPRATSQQIHAAWLVEVRRWHPDLNSNSTATERTQALNHAYQVLGDPTLRSRYDRTRVGRRVAPRAPPRRDAGQGSRGSDEARRRAAYDNERRAAQAERDAKRAADDAVRRAARAAWEERWAARRAAQAAREERERRIRPYLDSLRAMDDGYALDANGKRHLRESLTAALLSLPHLLVLLRELLPEVATYKPKGYFFSPWPPVTRGFFLAALLQDKGAFDQITAFLSQHSDLAPWRHIIEPARQRFLDVSAILWYVRSHPGTTQSKLGRELRQDQREVTSQLCRWLAEAGTLRRVRSGSSYALFAT